MHLSQSPAQCLVDCRAKVRARYLPLSGQGVVIWSELGTATLPSNLSIGATLLMTNSVSDRERLFLLAPFALSAEGRGCVLSQKCPLVLPKPPPSVQPGQRLLSLH